MTTADRLSMTLGQAMFTQRAIRRLKPDPIPDEVIRDLMESAIRAPNGGNTRKQLGELYHEAWWAKRKDQGIMGPEDIPPGKNSTRSAMRLANEFGDAPVMVLICALNKGGSGGIIPSAQNLLLAARAHGIGGTIATLHAVVDDRVKKLLNIPDTAEIVYCMPLGYPRGEFGSVTRKPLEEVCGIDRWDVPYK